MHFCMKPPHSNQEENKEGNQEEEEEDYINCIIENITQEILSRLKICCQILCCVPLEKIFKNNDTREPSYSSYKEKEKELTTNGNTSIWDDGHRTPKSKIRIMEKSKTKNNIENVQPNTYKSIRHRLLAHGDPEKLDRCIETKSSSIELYSRIEKIRILKELQITDIDRFIGGKADEKCIDTCDLVPVKKNECIDTSDLAIDNKRITDDTNSAVTKEIKEESKSMVTQEMAGEKEIAKEVENSVGDGPRVKIQRKPGIKMGAFFKKLFKSRTSVKKNVNNSQNTHDSDCERDCMKANEVENCLECQDLIDINSNNVEKRADGISLKMQCTAMAEVWRVRE